jgi:hypothetical protein
MPVVRVRSTKLRDDHLDVDDNGNLFVTSSSSTGPTLVGASTTGLATELEVAATVAAAANNQTLAASAGKRTFITGFHVGGLGATGASVITLTVTGISVTMTYRFSVPAGATLISPTLDVEFARPIPASADNTAIVVNVPTFGAGNTAADASARGYSV